MLSETAGFMALCVIHLMLVGRLPMVDPMEMALHPMAKVLHQAAKKEQVQVIQHLTGSQIYNIFIKTDMLPHTRQVIHALILGHFEFDYALIS